MPIYVYRNVVTGETFELEQRITEAALKVHPETGEPVQRLIQPVGIAFKGSGFYVTDSRNGSSTKAAAAPKAGDSQASSDSATKTESKSETKAETKAETKSSTESSSKSTSAAPAS